MSGEALQDRVPKLARGVRLHNDAARGAVVLLAPERILQPDPVAIEILKRVDGTASEAAIVDDLCTAYTAPREQVAADVRAFLDGLAEKGFLDYVK